MNEIIIPRMFGQRVASSIARINDHIDKHNLNISPQEYIAIGDNAVKTWEFYGQVPETLIAVSGYYVVIVNGQVEHDNNIYRILRSVFPAGSKSLRKFPPCPQSLRSYGIYL